MRTFFNAHRVFTGAPDRDDYLAALTIKDHDGSALRSARDQIREALRAGLRDWDQVVRKQDLFEAGFTVSAAETVPLRPKFRMQGSFAYHTINDPAQVPPQEIDLDDGVFLPTSFLSDNGNTHPIVASRGFFLAVERILEPLCARRGCRLDRSKPSCVRVIVSSRAHIDLPLYAIPDAEFAVLMEKSLRTAGLAAWAQIEDSIELAEPIYEQLREDEIMLAHRDDGWKPSDPRKIEAWFRAALDAHGEQLRRICRYLKGWRDHQWATRASRRLRSCNA